MRLALSLWRLGETRLEDFAGLIFRKKKSNRNHVKRFFKKLFYLNKLKFTAGAGSSPCGEAVNDCRQPQLRP